MPPTEGATMEDVDDEEMTAETNATTAKTIEMRTRNLPPSLPPDDNDGGSAGRAGVNNKTH
ncbi:hypothetical protein ACHAW5_009487 [Stephanodiscus triporus]|uniref:Uncharacterized protein n=1 Tax=Stephanodiscus triporus TaxID=2934178 RepID=A0ABD3NKR9_9STRA